MHCGPARVHLHRQRRKDSKMLINYACFKVTGSGQFLFSILTQCCGLIKHWRKTLNFKNTKEICFPQLPPPPPLPCFTDSSQQEWRPAPRSVSPSTQTGCGQPGRLQSSSKWNHTHSRGTAATPVCQLTLAPVTFQLEITVGTGCFPCGPWDHPIPFRGKRGHCCPGQIYS